MRKIVTENQFRRDIKKRYLELITPAWIEVINCLVNDIELPEKYCDHGLKGDWIDFRDCHIKPDLVLIYALREEREEYVQLVRFGSHSELFEKKKNK